MSVFNKLATLGKALMLPIAVMPIAGLLLRLGADDVLGRFFDAGFIAAAGNAIFGHLALIFGIGVAVGLAKKNHGAAALAAAVSYFVLTGVMEALAHTMYMKPMLTLQAGIYDKVINHATIDLIPLIKSVGHLPSHITASYLDKIHYLEYYTSLNPDTTITSSKELLSGVQVALSDLPQAINHLFTTHLYTAQTAKTAIMSDIGNSFVAEKKLDMGVLGGIIAGLVGAYSYNRFHITKLPDVLAFFSGRRLAPIMAGVISLIIGIVAAFIWGHVQDAIASLADGLVALGWVGSFIYGTLNRLLLSLGLHNVMNVFFWFNLGDFVNSHGVTVHGDITRFFAGDPTAGNFMAGFFPIMMFGLPGAGLAMYVTAKPQNKAEIGGLLLSVCVTAFLTGITEPIEYMFMFIAPLLYLFHAILTGISLALSNALHYHMGFTFSGGAIDALINYGASAASRPYMIFILGPIFFVVYFIVFTFAIKLFNIKTPGREDSHKGTLEVSDSDFSDVQKAQAYIEALGGLDNIISIDNCITRLRLEIHDVSEINEDAIHRMNNQGIVHPGGHSVQIILGSQVEFVANAMREIQDGSIHDLIGEVSPATSKPKSKAKIEASKDIVVLAPVEGTVVDLSDVPDITFAERIVGDGVAIQPMGNLICSPVSGEIISLPRECHAFMVKADNGLEFLVHVGLETVMLRGKGFRALAKVGSRVEAGDPILQVNWDDITNEVPSTVIPVLCSSMGSTNSFHVTATIGSTIKTGDKLFDIISK